MNNDLNTALSDGSLEHVLGTYLSVQWSRPVQVVELKRLAGGASRETWAFDAVTRVETDPPGVPDRRMPLIMRRDFKRNLLDGKLQDEFRLLNKLHQRGLPIPRPYCSDNGESAALTPFMITERVPGTDLRKALARAGNTLDRRGLGHRLVELQAAIHRLVWCEDLADVLPLPLKSVATQEIEHWATIFETQGPVSRPIVAAALAWLRSNVLADAEICLLHGDFKANNLLFAPDGTHDGRVWIIDWEMAHLGDPLEDLAWTLLWTTNDDLIGGLLSKAEYLAAYKVITNRAVDRRRLFYWELFSLVKLAAIFVSGVRPTADQAPARPMLAMLARGLPVLERDLARRLHMALAEWPT
ncbi:MAG: phosphotransferase family protein [Gammaproteobacteria bacterium]